MVRAHDAAKQAGLRLLVGSRLVFRDGTPDLIAYPEDHAGWGQLTQLLTLGKRRAPKGDCHLDRADVLGHAAGLVLLALPPERPDATFAAAFADLRAVLGRRLHLAADRRIGATDVQRLRTLATLDAGFAAVSEPLCHAPERRALHDVMTAIRLGATVERADHARCRTRNATSNRPP